MNWATKLTSHRKLWLLLQSIMEVRVRNLLFYLKHKQFFFKTYFFTVLWKPETNIENIKIIPPVFEGFAPNVVKDQYKELKLATQGCNNTLFFCTLLKNVNTYGKTLTIYFKAYFSILYILTSVCTFSILFSIQFFYADKENLFNNQELL